MYIKSNIFSYFNRDGTLKSKHNKRRKIELEQRVRKNKKRRKK